MSKTIKSWEIEKGIFFYDDKDLSKKVSEAEFDALLENANLYTRVDHKFRTKWLKDNGYEVTRENMINRELTARPTKK